MEADIYVHSTCKGPQKKAGVIAYVLEAELPDGKRVTKPHFFQIEGLSEQRSWLMATAMALEKIKEGKEAVIHGNSAYLANGFKNLEKWEENGWKRSNGLRVKNEDLWRWIFELKKSRKARFLSECRHPYSAWLQWEAEKRIGTAERADFTTFKEGKHV